MMNTLVSVCLDVTLEPQSHVTVEPQYVFTELLQSLGKLPESFFFFLSNRSLTTLLEFSRMTDAE